MNTTEAALTLRKVQAYRPSQIIDQLTIDAWQEAFDDIRFEDALLAVRNLGRTSSKYLDPAQIRTEVERLLAERKHAAHERKCYVCGGTWEQCSKRHAFEVRNGVPDPHEFESTETAERQTANTSDRAAQVRAQMATLLDGKNLRKGAGQ
jgi:hypothetical protein